MKRIFKDYFGFSGKERTAIILLVILAGCFIALPYFFSVSGNMPAPDPALVNFINNNHAGIGKETSRGSTEPGKKTAAMVPVVLFRFDPNTIDEEGWVRLGISPKTAATISKYRSKGGRFRVPADIKKIWGIPAGTVEKLLPYIDIKTTAPVTVYTDRYIDKPVTVSPVRPVIIDINTASAEEWKALPALGNTLSSRIIRYRELIGGFTSIQQVKKVYGITDSVFAVIETYLRISPETMGKLDLNTVTQNILAERTGISAELARSIIISRQQYGKFQSVEELKRIVIITDSVFKKIAPFVTVK